MNCGIDLGQSLLQYKNNQHGYDSLKALLSYKITDTDFDLPDSERYTSTSSIIYCNQKNTQQLNMIDYDSEKFIGFSNTNSHRPILAVPLINHSITNANLILKATAGFDGSTKTIPLTNKINIKDYTSKDLGTLNEGQYINVGISNPSSIGHLSLSENWKCSKILPVIGNYLFFTCPVSLSSTALDAVASIAFYSNLTRDSVISVEPLIKDGGGNMQWKLVNVPSEAQYFSVSIPVTQASDYKVYEVYNPTLLPRLYMDYSIKELGTLTENRYVNKSGGLSESSSWVASNFLLVNGDTLFFTCPTNQGNSTALNNVAAIFFYSDRSASSILSDVSLIDDSNADMQWKKVSVPEGTKYIRLSIRANQTEDYKLYECYKDNFMPSELEITTSSIDTDLATLHLQLMRCITDEEKAEIEDSNVGVRDPLYYNLIPLTFADTQANRDRGVVGQNVPNADKSVRITLHRGISNRINLTCEAYWNLSELDYITDWIKNTNSAQLAIVPIIECSGEQSVRCNAAWLNVELFHEKI